MKCKECKKELTDKSYEVDFQGKGFARAFCRECDLMFIKYLTVYRIEEDKYVEISSV